MLNRIRTFFIDRNAEPKDGCDKHDEDELHMAAAALLVEMANMDQDMQADERQRVIDLVIWRFGLNDEEAQDLVNRAESRNRESVQNFGFTQTVVEHFDHDERVQLVEMLWDVAYTDGHFHHLESYMMRRLAGLLHVTDQESGGARRRVLDRHENNPSA